jgi:hypothetical protein
VIRGSVDQPGQMEDMFIKKKREWRDKMKENKVNAI